MAIRTIRWTVGEDGMSLSPTTIQDGGVQGDHNKTRAEFVLPASLLSGYDFYIEYVDTLGGFDSTEQLTVERENVVGMLIPLAWTQHGGDAVLRLVVVKDGEIGYTLEGRVSYHSRATVFTKIQTLIHECIQSMLARMETAAEIVEKATDVDKAWETASAAKAAADAALERAESVRGIYTEGGDMPDGYDVQIDPDGEVLVMDEELNAESQNPVTNAAIVAGLRTRQRQITYGTDEPTGGEVGDVYIQILAE